jgi:hypothetical protein
VENLVDLLPLVFIALYYLLAGRRKAKQREAARQRTEAPQEALVQHERSGEVRSDTPFESFLEQLETAMAEAGGIETEARTVESTPVPPAAIETVPEFQTPKGSFDAPDAVDHEAHGFGAANPFSEESFERAPAYSAPPASGDPGYDPHQLQPPRPTRRTPTAPAWSRRLNDPQTARDAFVLQTIFGPRGGLRGDRSAKR